MPRHNAKLVLPTVATCPWRRMPKSGDAAECGLVEELAGTKLGRLAVVSESACEACCKSFPPSPRQLNPVVAGLLFSAASRIKDAGGTGQCSMEKAEQLKAFSEQSLELLFPDQFRLTPARVEARCCWLGEAVPIDSHFREQNGDGLEAFNKTDEPVFSCAHPEHRFTTASSCRTCRDWTKHKAISRFMSLRELVPPPRDRCGPAVRQWAVGVTTGPRRESTLESCLDSLLRAGWEEPRLFLDGSARVPLRYGHLPVTWREHRVGAWPAWYLALTELILQQPSADAYLLLQDDVVLHDREPLRSYLDEVLWPGSRPGLISLFYTGHVETPGWRCAQGNWDWGAQAFVFPPGVARALASDADMCRSTLAAAENHIPIPELICEWVTRRRISTWYPNPSLTQHIGNTSTIWMDAAISGGRRAPWFSGNVETEFAAEECLANFPEDVFLCPEAYRDQYAEQVERGRQRMREVGVVFCGVCRNVRHVLPRMAARVERLGAMFHDYRVVLCDNRSEDSTMEFLQDWRKVDSRVDLVKVGVAPAKPARGGSAMLPESMALCRNACRSHVLEKYADVDYVLVFEANVLGGWSVEGVAHTFSGVDWDVVGSYGLRHRRKPQPGKPPFLHFDAAAFRPLRENSVDVFDCDGELSLERGRPLLPVESCFGGLAIYRLECLRAAEYRKADCEHVIFHERLKQAGLKRILLNPSQIVVYTPF